MFEHPTLRDLPLQVIYFSFLNLRHLRAIFWYFGIKLPASGLSGLGKSKINIYLCTLLILKLK
jgi:hypothetical protein